jgi:DNA-binding transcriptional LysR family regulator
MGLVMDRADLPDLSSRELLAVLAVAHYRSFIAAAASQKLSQPAMTRMIKRVESELGIMLFDRTTRHVTVTQAGQEFAALAQRLLSDLKINVAHLRQKTDQPQGQVVVASVFSLADAMLPSLVADYGRQFPGVELHLREGFHSTVRDEVRSGLADFGIAYIEDAAEPFATEELSVDTFHVVAPMGHAFAARKSVSLQALASLPLVSFPQDSMTRRAVDHAAAAEGLSLHYVMTTNRLPTLHGLVRNRVGLGIVPEKERPSPAEKGVISRPLAGRLLRRRVGILRLQERELSPAARKFMEVVRKWIRKPPSV